MRGLNIPLEDIRSPIQFKVEGGQYSLALDANNEWEDPEHPQQDAVGVFIARTGVLVAALADEAGSLRGNGDLARGFVNHVLNSAAVLDQGKKWHPQTANYDACREAQYLYDDGVIQNNGIVGGSLIIHPDGKTIIHRFGDLQFGHTVSTKWAQTRNGLLPQNKAWERFIQNRVRSNQRPNQDELKWILSPDRSESPVVRGFLTSHAIPFGRNTGDEVHLNLKPGDGLLMASDGCGFYDPKRRPAFDELIRKASWTTDELAEVATLQGLQGEDNISAFTYRKHRQA